MAKLEKLTEDEQDECSFHCDGLSDGRVLTQHQYFRWGDVLIAVGELNRPNTWDDEAFDAACAAIGKALNGVSA